MVKTKRELIFATFIVSCAATVIAIVSIATDNWVTSEMIPVILPDSKTSYVNYGLFSGTYERYVLQSGNIYTLKTICLFSENVCAVSTSDSLEAREKEIKAILDGTLCQSDESLIPTTENTNDENLKNVQDILNNTEMEKNVYNIVNNKHELNGNFYDAKSSSPSSTETPKKSECDTTYMNAGLWLTTCLFLVAAILLGAMTATCSVANTAGNPVNPWFGLWGLQIWNGVAAGLHLITMVLWGAQFGALLSKNVALVDTLTGQFATVDGGTAIGYSYWLLLAPMILHLANIGILFLRQYLLDKEPEEPTIKHTETDGMIFVY